MNRLKHLNEIGSTLSLSEKVGQLFMPAAFINDSESAVQALERLIAERHVGGLCFFHSPASAATNFEGKKEVIYNADSLGTLQSLIARYQKAAQYPLLIAIDAEWGLAMRIENTPQYPYAITLGALADDDLIFQVGQHIAHDCRRAGIHWNLAPCVDVNTDPDNPVIGYRSFGEDRKKVARKALAYMGGLQSGGILSCLKHFPGHGDTATDSHLELPLIDKSKEALWAEELYPYRTLMTENLDAVMVGHLSVPSLAHGSNQSSSISKDIIHGILRGEMGFHGVVISDALNMHAVSRQYPIKGQLEWEAFNAGNDVLCFSENVKEGIDFIMSKASEGQIEERFARVWKLKEKAFSLAEQEPWGDKEFDVGDLNTKLAVQSLTLVKGGETALAAIRTRDFVGVEISQDASNPFFKDLQKRKEFRHVSVWENLPRIPLDGVPTDTLLLLALFPPKVKPTQKFGIPEAIWSFLPELMEQYEVVLYIFGNPYILNHLPIEMAKAVVVAYQDFESFQNVASRHFTGQVKARGQLPFQLARH